MEAMVSDRHPRLGGESDRKDGKPRLPKSQLAVLLFVASESRRGKPFPRTATIASAANVAVGNVGMCLYALAARGMVRLKSRRQIGKRVENVWELTPDGRVAAKDHIDG
jgi:hypothetical protein